MKTASNFFLSLQIKVLEVLGKRDPQNRWRCVRLQERFDYKGHVCMVMIAFVRIYAYSIRCLLKALCILACLYFGWNTFVVYIHVFLTAGLREAGAQPV